MSELNLRPCRVNFHETSIYYHSSFGDTIIYDPTLATRDH